MRYIAILILLFFCSCTGLFAQKVEGTVKNENGDILPFSSMLIKGTSKGFTANNQGRFEFTLAPGSYTLVCQHVGYEKQEKKVIVEKDNVKEDFILKQQRLQLKEVVVKSGDEDPAYEIIRQAIKKRDFYNKQVKAFTCEAYIKGLIKLRTLPNKIMGKRVPNEDRKSMGLDSAGKGIIFLSESITKVAMQQPKKYKLEVISGRESGGNGFGFNFPTFISLYDNNVSLFTERLNPRGFVSPIAYGALGFYKYKFMGSFFEDGKEVNVIKVIPRRNYEPLFSGTINITEGDWRIHSCDLMLTKTSQLQLLDTLQLTQIHVPVNDKVWRVRSQLIHFNFKMFGIDAIGNFVNVYSKYDLDPKFAKNYFDRVVIKYDTAVNKRSKAYWDTIRPVPLEIDEVKDYKIKDSIYESQKDSVLSRRSIDSLKKKQGPVTISQFLLNGINRVHYNKTNTYRWHLEPVIKSIQYTAVEGVVAEVEADYYKYLKKWKTNITVAPNFRYGFSNKKFYAWADVNFRTRDWSMDTKLKRSSWNIAGGKRVAQYNKESEVTPMGNTLGTLIYGTNNFKIYENNFGEVDYAKRFESGLRLEITALYEDRKPLNNISNYVLIQKNRGKITPNYPLEIMNSNFTPHQAAIVTAQVSFKPGQKYIQFPRNKVPIGSKYPTFTFVYTKGLQNVFGSDVDFDKWKFMVADNEVNLKLAGSIKYKFVMGGFLNKDKVFIQDFQHYHGNTSILAKSYANTFQLAGYYTLSNLSSFFSEIHLEHHLNGLLTNKIPMFKRLNWNMVDGVNAIYFTPGRYYSEVFAGLENILKVLRVDFVVGLQNDKSVKYGVRIGVGGIIGGSMSAQRFKGRSRL